MKISQMFNSLPKKLAATAIVALAVAFPMAASAAETVTIEGSMGVANVTNGQTTYQDSTTASYNQVVELQVYYHNRELPDSGKIANNLRVKINIPTTAGKTQQQTTTISADNSNTVTDTTTVNLDRDDAYLQYIPGTAVWRHNTGTNTNLNVVNTPISDDVVTGSNGVILENEQPCYNFAATVTVQARVMIPGTKVVKQVEKANESGKWATENTANPGDTLKYMITYTNTGNTTANNVIVRDNLPPNMTLVKGTTVLTDGAHPNGLKDTTDAVASDGLIIGNYAPGITAYVTFEVKIDDASKLQCGLTRFTNIGIAHPQNTPEYYNTAYTNVTKTCVATAPSAPVYTCNLFSISQGSNRTVSVSNFGYTAQNGATFSNVVLDWGDNSAPLTTNTAIGQSHQYAADGTYTITATPHFMVNGKDVTATSSACVQQVSYSTPAAPAAPVTPAAPTTLVNTGPGQIIGLFALATAVGVIAHRLIVRRRAA